LCAGEFVAQVPYFPPVQSIDDFPRARCVELVRKAADVALADVDVLRVRAWAMHAQVAAECAPRLVFLVSMWRKNVVSCGFLLRWWLMQECSLLSVSLPGVPMGTSRHLP
jgi:hypothetical protein